MKPITEQHLALFRRHMVELVDLQFELASEEIGHDTVDPALRQALLDVPRHLFVPQPLMLMSYQDTPLPIGFDKTISQPFIGALMIDLLGIETGSRVLEVGTGLGYQAALMDRMGAEVFTIDVVEEFAEAAQERFAALGCQIQVRIGDGSRGWADHAPYDRILVTAAASEPPPALFEQLRLGGRMVIPLGAEEIQQLSVIDKRPDGDVSIRQIMPVRFTRLEEAASTAAPG